MKVHEYLKIQQQEKARQRDAERQERYELQRLQEIDAQVCRHEPSSGCGFSVLTLPVHHFFTSC